ncbi:kynurenine formamidase [Micromonospora sp. Llam0]|uniref:cyclase family protein n=1 Tax=Micromonospora sp. Llam0 TaxID=2485143 RepID=UPI000F9120E1|nr:cyclase family protein [Micromonospora sp. Llam0]ROO63175.1 kynurenine formamidase [Micromonospora sp. Llam0]
MTEYRAVFDAEVTFLNGGGLQTQGFRLDLPAADIAENELANLLIGHLGLLMVDQVRISRLRVVREPDKGSRDVPTTATPASPGRLVELNHVIEAGMTTYPGLPGPEITPHLTREDSRTRYAPGVEFAIDLISMVGNTGTYLDSPYHRYADGADLAALPLETVADLPTVVVRLVDLDQRGIGPQALAALDLAGAAVLLHTGWDRHWGSEAYGDPAPYLTEPAAKLLADAGARLVGIDSVNIDDMYSGGQRPAHSILLDAGVPVLEHLTGLADLPATGARLHAAPPRVRGFGTFPVRAYAIVPR